MKFFIIFLTLIVAISLQAQNAPKVYTTMTKDTGELAYPTKESFTQANNIVTNEVVCLRVDMLGTDTIWKDAEIKILDNEGELLYFATTMYNDYLNYHRTDGTWDENCKIFYYVAGTKHSAKGQCSSPKQRHIVDSTHRYSIAVKESARITAIEFFPNLSGTINGMSIRSIVLDPDNTIIISRKASNKQEKDSAGNRIWRPVIPQYYRAYPVSKEELGE